MNKYEKALKDVANETVDGYYQPKTVEHFHSEAIGILRELVERAIPQKLLYNGEYVSFCNCPNCKKVVPIHGNYCPRCGQRLNWRVEDVD